MGFLDNIRGRIIKWLTPDEAFDKVRIARLTAMEIRNSYHEGRQKLPLKVGKNGNDDNIIHNFSKLIVDRSVTMLVGGGVEFDLPGEPDADNQEFIDGVWDANKRDLLLNDAAEYASVFDTGYLKIIPQGVTVDGESTDRIITLDPRWMTIISEPEDINMVKAYETRFSVVEDDEVVQRRELTSRHFGSQDEEGRPTDEFWTIENFVLNRAGRWEQIGETIVWEFDFAPIVHWKNLPNAGSQYGVSDIGGVLDEQDRINYTSSNISKIIRYHAHPKTWIKGGKISDVLSWGPDNIVQLQGDSASIQNLEMQTELTASSDYLLFLRQAMFDLTRTVDITSLADEIGALTNFGIRVLFFDALSKLKTKQTLLAEALSEINRRLLVINGADDTDTGIVIYKDPLPVDRLEAMRAVQVELGAGLVSKHTAANEQGRDWEEEQERLEEERENEDGLGVNLLDQFNRGF